jgi:hypothetical protein
MLPPCLFLTKLIFRALTTAQNRLMYGSIIQDTQHIIFIDTPHRGIDQSISNSVTSISTDDGEYLEFLHPNSTVLLELNRTFASIAMKIKFTSCFASESEIDANG